MKMTWKTFERKMKDGDLEVLAWEFGRDDVADVLVWTASGSRVRQVVELTGKPSAEWEAE